MATPIKPKGPPGKRRKVRKKPRKAKPQPGATGLKETVYLRGIGTGKKLVQFTLSEDVMEKLMDLHDSRYHPLLYVPRRQRMRRIRVQFVRLVDAGMPGVMLMIEPPTYDPRGKLAKRNQRRYEVSISARKIGLINGMPRRDPEWFWADNMQGLIILLPDEDMSGEPPPKRQPGDPIDLVAR